MADLETLNGSFGLRYIKWWGKIRRERQHCCRGEGVSEVILIIVSCLSVLLGQLAAVKSWGGLCGSKEGKMDNKGNPGNKKRPLSIFGLSSTQECRAYSLPVLCGIQVILGRWVKPSHKGPSLVADQRLAWSSLRDNSCQEHTCGACLSGAVQWPASHISSMVQLIQCTCTSGHSLLKHLHGALQSAVGLFGIALNGSCFPARTGFLRLHSVTCLSSSKLGERTGATCSIRVFLLLTQLLPLVCECISHTTSLFPSLLHTEMQNTAVHFKVSSLSLFPNHNAYLLQQGRKLGGDF